MTNDNFVSFLSIDVSGVIITYTQPDFSNMLYLFPPHDSHTIHPRILSIRQIAIAGAAGRTDFPQQITLPDSRAQITCDYALKLYKSLIV